MKFQLYLLLMSISTYALGFSIPEEYHSGIEVCEANKNYIPESEIGKWIRVPISYSSLNKGTTPIYTYTLKPFNAELPSVIYFVGGPGGTAHGGEFDLPNTNVIFFEQRGISCSRPDTKELFLDPNFYSSENTARDALEVVKSYGIKKVTSYGQSYGTVPATIFASLFPQNTNSLIIEGVIYDGGKSLWHSERKLQILQTFLNNLPKEKRDKIVEYSTNGKLPTSWYANLGNMILYLNDGVTVFSEFLNNVLEMDESAMIEFVKGFYPTEESMRAPENEWSYGDVVMGMIACQELTMASKNVSMYSTLDKNGKLTFANENHQRFENCIPLHLENNDGKKTYHATQYPVKVPVTYFLGENDGATDLDQGLNHFNNVAKGKKTALILKNGGHGPILGQMKDRGYCTPSTSPDGCKQGDLSFEIFASIIANKGNVDKSLIETYNQSGSFSFKLLNSSRD